MESIKNDCGRTGSNNAFFRQLLFLGVLILIGVVIFTQLGFFVGSFLGASTVYIVLRGVLFRMTERWGWKHWIASGVLVAAATLVLLGLGFLIFEVIASEIPNVDTSRIVEVFHDSLRWINRELGFDLIPQNILAGSGGALTRIASMLINTTYSFAANIFMMLVVLFFMLQNARGMEARITAYLPFRGRSLDMVKSEVRGIIFSNAVGIPAVMFAQALTAALIYWMFGLNNVVFWAFMTAVCGLVPMVGTVLVSAPLGIFLILSGSVWQGTALIACGLLIIANVDNLCRIILMKSITDTHPLIVIFGVILGIPLFGFWGIIFGPLLISGFLLLIRIYYAEYRPVPPETSQKE